MASARATRRASLRSSTEQQRPAAGAPAPSGARRSETPMTSWPPRPGGQRAKPGRGAGGGPPPRAGGPPDPAFYVIYKLPNQKKLTLDLLLSPDPNFLSPGERDHH